MTRSHTNPSTANPSTANPFRNKTPYLNPKKETRQQEAAVVSSEKTSCPKNGPTIVALHLFPSSSEAKKALKTLQKDQSELNHDLLANWELVRNTGAFHAYQRIRAAHEPRPYTPCVKSPEKTVSFL
jgi:hypothetical protein